MTLEELGNFSINFGLVAFLLPCFVVIWVFVESEAFYHVLWQDEAAESKCYLLQELVFLCFGAVGCVADETSVEAALREEQDLEWEEDVLYLQVPLAIVELVLEEPVELGTEELPYVSEEVLVDTLIASTSLHFGLSMLVVLAVLVAAELLLYSLFYIELEFQSIFVQDQLGCL